MRILAITHLYPTPDQTSFAPFNRFQFAELGRLHELRIIRPLSWPVWLAHGLAGRRTPGLYHSEDGIPVHAPTYIYPPLVLRHAYGTFLDRSIARAAGIELRDSRPDVLLGSWAHPDGWAAVQIGRRTNIPVVVKVHGSDVLVHAVGKRRARVAEALQGADAIVAVSHDLARKVEALGVPGARIHVVPHGLDAQRFRPGNQRESRRRLGISADEPMILFVGHVLASKGAEDLVRACGVLRDRAVRFQCRLVGEGRDGVAVQRLVRSLQLDRQVVLAGARPHHELSDWYCASDVVTLPSHSEGIPNVLREALACGRPFVATNVGGIPEIADPAWTSLVAPHAVNDLADALVAMLQSPPRVATDRVLPINIGWEASARLLADVLMSVVEARNGTRPSLLPASRWSVA